MNPQKKAILVWLVSAVVVFSLLFFYVQSKVEGPAQSAQEPVFVKDGTFRLEGEVVVPRMRPDQLGANLTRYTHIKTNDTSVVVFNYANESESKELFLKYLEREPPRRKFPLTGGPDVFLLPPSDQNTTRIYWLFQTHHVLISLPGNLSASNHYRFVEYYLKLYRPTGLD